MTNFKPIRALGAATLAAALALTGFGIGITGAWMHARLTATGEIVGAYMDYSPQILLGDVPLAPDPQGSYALQSGVTYTVRADFTGSAQSPCLLFFGGGDQLLLTPAAPTVTYTPTVSALYSFAPGWGELIPTAPEYIAPETTVPETTIPETTTPETTIPETTVPETTIPETTVPETTIPETTVPETTIPETTVPETTIPETTVPETTTPETTVPETTTPETTVPETTTPETTVPETTTPETTAPETTAPAAAVPETSEPETSEPPTT